MKSTSLLGSTLQLTAVSLLSQLLYFLYQVALSRMVGTEVLGLIHMVMPVYYTFLSFLTSGFALAVCKLSSEYQSKNNHQALGQVVSHTTQLFSCGFLLFGLLLLLGYRVFAEQYFQQAPPLLFLLAVPMLLFFTAQEIFNKHYFYGTNSVHIPAVIQITEQLIRMAAVLLLLLIFPQTSPLDAVLLILLGMLVSEIYSSLHLTYLRKQQPVTLPFPHFRWAKRRSYESQHLAHRTPRLPDHLFLPVYFYFKRGYHSKFASAVRPGTNCRSPALWDPIRDDTASFNGSLFIDQCTFYCLTSLPVPLSGFAAVETDPQHTARQFSGYSPFCRPCNIGHRCLWHSTGPFMLRSTGGRCLYSAFGCRGHPIRL